MSIGSKIGATAGSAYGPWGSLAGELIGSYLDPEQQQLLQSGVPLSQINPELNQYIQEMEAKKQQQMMQPMYKAYGGPIPANNGRLSGYNPQGPLAYTNIGKTYEPYKYVYKPSEKEEVATAPLAPSCPVGTTYDPVSGQCVDNGGSGAPDVNTNKGGYGQAPTSDYQAYVDENGMAPLNDGSFSKDNYYGDNAGGTNLSGNSYTPQYNFNPKAFSPQYDNQKYDYDPETGTARATNRGIGDAVVDVASMAVPGAGALGLGAYYDDAEDAMSGKNKLNVPQRAMKTVGEIFDQKVKEPLKDLLADPIGDLSGILDLPEAKKPEDIPVEERETDLKEKRQERNKEIRESRMEEALRVKAERDAEAARAEAARKAQIAKERRYNNTDTSSGGGYNWGSASSSSRSSSALGGGSSVGSRGGNASRGYSSGGW